MTIKSISPQFSVSPQIQPEQVQDLAALGFTAVVNNRPDLEEAAQPLSETLENACKAAQLDYIHLPMKGPNYSAEQVNQLKQFLKKNDQVLGFCRSGQRATLLFNAAQ